MKKVAIYARVSTDEQSVNLQKEKLIKYCREKGYKYFGYYDEGISAISKDRPRFNQLLKDAENKKFEAVIVTKLDRFGRSVKDLVNSIERLKELGIDFISLGDNIDTTTPNGKLLFHILSAFAEFEREIIRERIKLGREKAKEEGKLMHRPLKELDDKQIKKYYLENRLSIRAVAKIYKVHPATISRRLKDMGVEVR